MSSVNSYSPQEVINNEDSEKLVEEINREFIKIRDALDAQYDLLSGENLPKTLSGVAFLRYFDGQTFDPGLGAGLYLMEGGVWKKVTLTAVP